MRTLLITLSFSRSCMCFWKICILLSNIHRLGFFCWLHLALFLSRGTVLIRPWDDVFTINNRFTRYSPECCCWRRRRNWRLRLALVAGSQVSNFLLALAAAAGVEAAVLHVIKAPYLKHCLFHIWGTFNFLKCLYCQANLPYMTK